MKKIFPIVLFSLGVFFFILGIKILYDMYKFRRTAIKATARVIEVKNSTGKNNVKTYSPVLSFKTADGVDYVYDVGTYYPTEYTIGQQIKVVYPKENPSQVKIDSFRFTFMMPVTLILLGIFGMGMGVWLFMKK